MRKIQKSIIEIEDFFVQVVCEILGLNTQTNQGIVRISWGSNIDTKSMSAPNANINEDVCFIQITPYEDAINRQRHTRYVYDGGEDMLVLDEHTDVHQVLFVNYGANAYENASAIRDGLFKNDIRRLLRLNHFALVTDIQASRRVPELVNASWVNRVDVSAIFNQFVRLVDTITTIEHVSVISVRENGNTRKFEIR